MKTKRSVLSLFNFSLFAVIQRLISWMHSSIRDLETSGSTLSDGRKDIIIMIYLGIVSVEMIRHVVFYDYLYTLNLRM